jgi:hypothetical protein
MSCSSVHQKSICLESHVTRARNSSSIAAGSSGTSFHTVFMQLVAPRQPLLDDAVHDLLGRLLLAPGLVPPTSWSLSRCCLTHCGADLLKAGLDGI